MADRNPPKRSSRSKKAKLGKNPQSRRGFKKKIEIEQNVNNDNVNNVAMESSINPLPSRPTTPAALPQLKPPTLPQPNPPTLPPTTIFTTPIPSSSLKYRKVTNRSSEKLKNSLFSRLYIGKTRSQSRRYGVRRLHVKSKASCYKVMDAELLSSSILNAAICGHCKDLKSRLVLQQLPEKRAGLCETLQWECSACHHVTKFQTSKKGIKGSMSIPAYDVNIRSVYGSQTIGRAGLSKFCNVMNIPPPIRPTPFNTIQNKLSEVALSNAEISMKEAGKNLFDSILKDNPENAEYSEESGEITVNAAVTVDGTWQRKIKMNHSMVYFG